MSFFNFANNEKNIQLRKQKRLYLKRNLLLQNKQNFLFLHHIESFLNIYFFRSNVLWLNFYTFDYCRDKIFKYFNNLKIDLTFYYYQINFFNIYFFNFFWFKKFLNVYFNLYNYYILMCRLSKVKIYEFSYFFAILLYTLDFYLDVKTLSFTRLNNLQGAWMFKRAIDFTLTEFYISFLVFINK